MHLDHAARVPCLLHHLPFLCIYLVLAVLGLHCVQTFSSCSEQGLLFVAVQGLLIVVASHCGCRARALEHGLSSCIAGFSRPTACGIFLDSIFHGFDGIHVPCIDRWILNHWTTREAPICSSGSIFHGFLQSDCITFSNILPSAFRTSVYCFLME